MSRAHKEQRCGGEFRLFPDDHSLEHFTSVMANDSAVCLM